MVRYMIVKGTDENEEVVNGGPFEVLTAEMLVEMLNQRWEIDTNIAFVKGNITEEEKNEMLSNVKYKLKKV